MDGGEGEEGEEERGRQRQGHEKERPKKETSREREMNSKLDRETEAETAQTTRAAIRYMSYGLQLLPLALR
jgi:hypothetical protein